MKILITGGAGLIGQAIAMKHINEGDEVFIYDNCSNIFNDYSKILGLNLYGIPIDEILKTKFDVISHQASSVGVGESQYNIEKYFINNITFTSNIIQAIINSDNSPKKILHAGSMGPYGEGTYWCTKCQCQVFFTKQRITLKLKCHCGNDVVSLHILEECQLNPQSIYAVTKMTQEHTLRVFSQTYGIPTVSLRYFSVYGMNSNPGNPFTGVLSVIANKIINSDIIEINEDGEQTRDLISANDCAEAHYAACNTELSGFNVINIGTGKSRSMLYIAKKMIELLNPYKRIICNNNIRLGDIKHSCSCCHKAHTLLKWLHKDDIDQSIPTYCDFIQKNWDKFKKDDTSLEADKILKQYNLYVRSSI